MSLSALIARSVNTAFNAVGDIARAVTYTSKSDGTYNPAVGDTSAANTSFSISKAIITSYRAREIDGTVVQAGDQKVLIKAEDLAGVTPKAKDSITVDAVVWEIVSAMADPSLALWTFQVRR